MSQAGRYERHAQPFCGSLRSSRLGSFTELGGLARRFCITVGNKWSQWIEFTKFGIGSAPTTIGVYCLTKGGEITYYGKAEGQGGIHGRLLDHLSGDAGVCTQSARQYCYRECADPSQVAHGLIESYVEEHGKPPKCNDKV